jgi:hypothetical protein
MARKVGQIVGRGRRTCLVLVYNGHDPETKKRKYLNQTIHGGLRDAQAHLNKCSASETPPGIWTHPQPARAQECTPY